MENFTVPIEIFSPDGSLSVTVEAMLETRNCYSCLPGTLLRDLGITPVRRIESELADGSVVEDEIGEVRVKLEGNETVTIAIFGSNSDPAKLGHLTLTGALLEFDPLNRCLVPVRALRPTRILIGESKAPQIYRS